MSRTSLLFGAAITDRVTIGTPAPLNGLPAATLQAWLFPQSFPANARILSKIQTSGSFPGWDFHINSSTGNLSFGIARATSNMSYITNTLPLLTNRWGFVCATYDSTGGHIYVGDLANAPVEAGYSTSTAGSGTITDDSPGIAYIGNASTFGLAFGGRIAIATVIASAKSLADIRNDWLISRSPAYLSARLRAVAAWSLGEDGLGPQRDYSGNGCVGALTGTSISEGLPLAIPMFRDRRRWLAG